MNSRKVAIIAGGGTASLAPFRDEAWELWGMPWIHYPRITHLFEIHADDFYTGPDAERDGTIAETAERFPEVPVYCHPSRACLFKNPVTYPIEDVLTLLPIPYLESTVAYQLAFALRERVNEVALYGVHQIGEYIWEKPCVTYLVGLLQGNGIRVSIVPGSPLFMSKHKAGRYGLGGGERFKETL